MMRLVSILCPSTGVPRGQAGSVDGMRLGSMLHRAMHWSDALSVSSPYRWTMLGGILLTALLWYIRTQRNPDLFIIYVGALGGAFIGAKIAFLIAEGATIWPSPDRWLLVAAGKSVVGGILGGYLGVEGMKALIGHRESTGDLFAPIIPLGVALGRVGCWLHGCCLGVPMAEGWWSLKDKHGVSRWPSSQVELLFQVLAFGIIVAMRKRWAGRLFPFYLAAYGTFRFVHEWLRDTPKWWGVISGYQVLALLMAGLGVWKWRSAKRSEAN